MEKYSLLNEVLQLKQSIAPPQSIFDIRNSELGLFRKRKSGDLMLDRNIE